MTSRIFQFQEIKIDTVFAVWHTTLKWYIKINDNQGKDKLTGEILTFEKIDLVMINQ